MLAETDWGTVIPLISGGIVAVLGAFTAMIVTLKKAFAKASNEAAEVAVKATTAATQVAADATAAASEVAKKVVETSTTAMAQNTIEHDKTSAKLDAQTTTITRKLDVIIKQQADQAKVNKNLTDGQEVLFNMIVSLDQKLPNPGNSKGTSVPQVSRGN